MRVLVLNILVLLSTVLYGQIYSAANSSLGRTGSCRSEMYSGMSVSGRNNIVTYSNSNIGYTSRTGYTTSIGYTTSTGRSVYGGNSPFKGYSTYRGIYTNPVATGRGMNYNPNMQYGGSSSNGGGPRRITVYDADGNPYETPGGDNDNPDWLYRYDASTRKWYCSTDNGETWYEWRDKRWWEALITGLFGGDWSSGENWYEYRGSGTPSGQTVQATPITDTPWLIMLLLGVGYIAFVSFRRRKTQKS